jgi:hypothetical protein
MSSLSLAAIMAAVSSISAKTTPQAPSLAKARAQCLPIPLPVILLGLNLEMSTPYAPAPVTSAYPSSR